MTIDRIRTSYLRAIEAHQAENSEIWRHITGSIQRDVHEALVKGGEPLRSMLSDPATTNLYYGVDDICTASLSGPIPPARQLHADFSAAFAQLASMIGADRMPNPEGGLTYKGKVAAQRSIEESLALLDATLLAPVDFPNPFRGEIFAAATPRGFISHRALHAIYQAHRLVQVSPRGNARCLEIGGGTGRTSYYAVKWGIPAYTIVDLPMASVGQACFLMATLGLDKVSLYGEENEHAPVRLRPPHWLFTAGERFDVALNSDSLPEMSLEYAERYIAFIKANCRAFISINHEANRFTVRELWPGLMRFPYTLRPGYLEEFTSPME